METRSPYATASLPASASQLDHPLRHLLGNERADRVLAGGKWRVLLHVAGGKCKAEVTEVDISVGEAA